jgi:hypothetical protein
MRTTVTARIDQVLSTLPPEARRLDLGEEE